MIKYLFVLFPITVFSQGYETQKYDLLKTIDNIEIRYFPFNKGKS